MPLADITKNIGPSFNRQDSKNSVVVVSIMERKLQHPNESSSWPTGSTPTWPHRPPAGKYKYVPHVTWSTTARRRYKSSKKGLIKHLIIIYDNEGGLNVNININVHRDLKPANIYMNNNDKIVHGDMKPAKRLQQTYSPEIKSRYNFWFWIYFESNYNKPKNYQPGKAEKIPHNPPHNPCESHRSMKILLGSLHCG